MRVLGTVGVLAAAVLVAALVPIITGGRPTPLRPTPPDAAAATTRGGPPPAPVVAASPRPNPDVAPQRPTISSLLPAPSPGPGGTPATSAAPGASPGSGSLTARPAAAPRPPATTDVNCQFLQGFRQLRDLIGEAIVGDCLGDVRYDAQGNAQQVTTGGTLLWRKADNWTAFTDGEQTWVYGPFGLQVRSSQARFLWEQP